jgi:hypothetical protein
MRRVSSWCVKLSHDPPPVRPLLRRWALRERSRLGREDLQLAKRSPGAVWVTVASPNRMTMRFDREPVGLLWPHGTGVVTKN